MIEYIKKNKLFVSLLSFSVLFALFVCVAQGCNIQELISVDAPPAILAVAENIPEGKMSLADVDYAWNEWNHYVTTNTELFKVAVEDAESRYLFVESLTNTGLGVLQGAGESFPMGGIILSLLTGGTGLLLKRPKEDARVAAEKESSFNKGVEVGKSLVADIKSNT